MGKISNSTGDAFSAILSHCHNIIRDNDKLSPEAAFDEISKVLFVKIQRERKDSALFSFSRYDSERWTYLENYVQDNTPYYQFLFAQAKINWLDSTIFDEHEQMRIRESSFDDIIKALEGVDLSIMQEDYKGMAFEHFLGKTFRGELGQFFTPRAIVEFMIKIINPSYGDVICDPCCGSGGFLIGVYTKVRKEIESNPSLSEEEAICRIQHLSSSCLYGVDANMRMARVAKMNMIMHGDGHTCVFHHDGLLNVKGVYDGRFDIVLTNPPFGSRVSKAMLVRESDTLCGSEEDKELLSLDGYEQALENDKVLIGKPIISLFNTGKYTNISEVLFLERCLNLLRPNGRLGIVLPEGVLNNRNLQPVREYIESQAQILLIVSLPVEVFLSSGAAIKSSIVFLRKYSNEERLLYQKTLSMATKEAEERISGYGVQDESPNSIVHQGGKRLASRKDAIHSEAYYTLKRILDYKIPMASVNLNGTGTSAWNDIEIQLNEIAEEYSKYRLSLQ